MNQEQKLNYIITSIKQSMKVDKEIQESLSEKDYPGKKYYSGRYDAMALLLTKIETMEDNRRY